MSTNKFRGERSLYGQAVADLYDAAKRKGRSFYSDCHKLGLHHTSVCPYFNPRPKSLVKPIHFANMRSVIGDLSKAEQAKLAVELMKETDVLMPKAIGHTPVLAYEGLCTMLEMAYGAAS